MPAIRLEDLHMMYSDSVVLYKDRPVYVLGIGEGKVFSILDIATQERDDVAFKEKDFSAPTRRIGMVNIDGNCVYVSRNPVRKYSVGFNHGNITVKQLEGASLTMPFKAVYSLAVGLRHVGIGKAIDNLYPSLPEALKTVKANGGCQAFDKQFAVDKKNNVFYKTRLVGSCNWDARSEEEIEFRPGQSFLRLLLLNNYQRSLGSTA